MRTSCNGLPTIPQSRDAWVYNQGCAFHPEPMPLDRTTAAPSQRTIVRAACPHDCPDTCAMHVTVENGRAVAIAGDPLHPTTRGTLCTKVARYLDRTYSEQRVLHPLRRVGRKGERLF